jgi:hypothetical protein
MKPIWDGKTHGELESYCDGVRQILRYAVQLAEISGYDCWFEVIDICHSELDFAFNPIEPQEDYHDYPTQDEVIDRIDRDERDRLQNKVQTPVFVASRIPFNRYDLY